MDIQQINTIIDKYGLQIASKREIPLFTFSCISLGYVNLMEELMGFSYRVIGSLGKDGYFESLFNEKYMADMTGELIEKDFDKIESILTKSNDIFQEFCDGFKIAQSDTDPYVLLQFLVDNYSKYILSISVPNCFWRYLGNEETKGPLTKEWVEKIGILRDDIAKLYPIVEKALKVNTHEIGKELLIDGDILRYLLIHEMQDFIHSKKLSAELITALNKRRDEYLYLYIDNIEYVYTDKGIIQGIRDRFNTVDLDNNTIKGHISFPGKVKGLVYNMDDNDKAPEGEYILVASMTNPNDIHLIKNCLAIITNEGGTLSHAAIISRELHKPCITATKIATKVLKDGMEVEVDADKGVVTIL